ncbi:hypothetical protein VKT23_003387 [Stygiomarasmius scandens]
MSRTSMTGLANLPPSPPIHKERERRRLRKKSRPSEPAYEMSIRHPMLSSRESLPEEDEFMPSVTPPPTSPDVANTPSSNRNSTNFSSGVAPSTPAGKTPLLSRIGSVKKWSTRKKRSSSTPSEVVNEYETPKYTGLPPPSSSPPSGKSNWFFRSAGQGPSSSDMATDESDVNTPRKPANNKPEDTSAKLVKRKSFGFVPIGRQPAFSDRGEVPIPPMPGSQSDLPSDLESELKTDSDIAVPSKKKKNRSSQPPQPRHASYGGIGLGRASAPSSTDDLPRSRSYSRSKSRDKRGGAEEAEGSRSFMGSVRRISLVGRHKRTKSGVSLSGVEEGLRSSTEPPPPPPIPPQYDEMDMDAEPPGTRTPSRTSNLLPPIELQPPSPPRRDSDKDYASENLDSFLLSSSSSPPKSPSSPSLILKSTTPKAAPHTASLGRSTVAPNISVNTNSVISGSVPRRNSLGDLKIPARITRAQDGLRRDLGMVREFAANIEQLKDLLSTYNALVFQVQTIIDTHVQQSQSSSRAASPIFRPLSRVRPVTPNNDYKNMASSFYTIKSKYKVAWECAELLIELSGGPPASSSSSGPTSPPSTSTSAPAISQTQSQRASFDDNGRKGARERAVTLSGEESKPPTPIPGAMPNSQGPPIASPPNMAWRASTGRHDLSQRQLLLLREMLNNPDPALVAEASGQGRGHSPHLPFDDSTMVNRDWRWGEAMNSTVTLPSEESSAYAAHSQGQGQGGSKISSEAKKRRTSRLGMSGLRDMLKMLTRSVQQHPPPMPSTTSLSTNSSVDSQNPHKYPHGKVPTYGRRRAKTSTGPDSVSSMRERDSGHGHGQARAPSPYNAVNISSLSVKSSPRRPSLASIFRIGTKTKSASTTSSSQPSANASNDGLSVDNPHTRESSSSTGEEDWDRIDSPDLEPPLSARATTGNRDAATIRGRSPYMQNARLPSTSSSGSNTNNQRPETPKRSASGSQTSLWGSDLPPGTGSPITASASGGIPSRTTRLSNVEEHVDDTNAATPYAKRVGAPSPVRTRSGRIPTGASKTGSVRSMPPQPLSATLPEPQLAMTPENIKPLLENAKEVHSRLTECINEVRVLLAES